MTLEAANFGIPIVGFSGSGGVEVFGADGNAVLVPYLDIDAMAEASKYHLAAPEERTILGLKARERVIGKFNVDTSCKLIADLIEETVSRHRPDVLSGTS